MVLKGKALDSFVKEEVRNRVYASVSCPQRQIKLDCQAQHPLSLLEDKRFQQLYSFLQECQCEFVHEICIHVPKYDYFDLGLLAKIPSISIFGGDRVGGVEKLQIQVT